MALAESFTIDNPKTLGLLLADQPANRAHTIATRAALRVLPLTFEPLTDAPLQTPNVLVLRAFRATFIAWTSVIQDYARDLSKAAASAAGAPTSGAISGAAAAAAASAAAHAAASVAEEAISGTAGPISGAASVLVNAAGAAADAAAAASFVSETAEMDIWDSITADVHWLAHNTSNRLIEQALWLNDVRGDPKFQANFPLWVRKPFDAYDRSHSVTSGPWGVWLSWYRAILPNGRNLQPRSLFGRDIDIKLATKDPSFWDRDPDKVTAEIAKLVVWRRKGPTRSTAPNNKPTTEPLSSSDRQKPAPEQDQVEAAFEGASLIDENVGKRQIESVEPQSDEPTSEDQLGRRPFAQALVERMDKVSKKRGDQGFAVHIHAPWGAGKTSVLKMMRALMIDEKRKTNDKLAPKWVVVEFNAWEHERRNPPWWPLMEEVKTECLKRLSASKVGWFRALTAYGTSLWCASDQSQDPAALLQARWIWWKLRTDALPYVVTAVVALLLFYFLSSSGGALESILKGITAILAAYAAFLGASRVAVFGSANNAKFYEDISQDPLKRITTLFKEIVNKTKMPVCIFIDDLDRCRAEYVVDLLEGIQTSFRHERVAYVVAADRSWLKASFESRYGAFSSAVGNVGQPLGYLFLEKVFQVSTPVPGMGDKTRTAYWTRLLKGTVPSQGNAQEGSPSAGDNVPLGSAANAQFDRVVESKRANVRETHGDNITREEAEAILERSDTEEDRAAVVLELNASRAAEKEAEHLLAQFTGIVPDNPRVMKRMVNAFAMRQAIGMLERNTTPSAVLARWTILEQRFPALADLLIERPEWTQTLAGEVGSEDREKMSPLLLPFADSEIVRNIIGKSDDYGLTVEHVRAITRGSAN